MTIPLCVDLILDSGKQMHYSEEIISSIYQTGVDLKQEYGACYQGPNFFVILL